MPKDELPQNGLGTGTLVKQMIMDELLLDGNPRQNLASFVTTWMEPEAEELMMEGMKKNYIDFDEYPQTAELHNRCVTMLSHLFNAPLGGDDKGTGTGTIGSSEAIMLAGLAMKWRWQKRRKSQNLSTEKPNLVCGSNIQVCWHKMCRYFDIECREAPVSPDCLVLTAERAKPLIDENTIGVCAILGSTFNGEFENVKEIHDLIVEINKENNWEVPIHVDAASGGFIAPFIHPQLEWDFRLPMVKSINVSGHKFGLVYAGIGWVLFREKDDLPDDLVFHVNYLGGDQASFTLNFSRGASGIIGQYYQFLRLGHSGYTQVMENGMKTSQYLRGLIKDIGKFDIVDTADMPLVSFALKDTNNCTVFDLQDHLRGRGWIVPAYCCSKGAESLKIMRVVVKQNFTTDLADLLVRDLVGALHHFEQFPAYDSKIMKEKSEFTKKAAEKKESEASKKLWRAAVELLQKKNMRNTDSEKTHGVC
eukprot:CAMPEP_0117009696 /NCGR_PEP_ID=MMETSP0472-20121206/8735_1 /TAXON_ID=693140 ORGANISM="Tiarina fusus, Strain LIS" /NCGR_SAMPLE_ID=MMETSP0472 /ASSEMBLY_ACC=CAM_ASM_000603 /LENGTH=476 /DNA_ID=CAMNT_0004712041 /DNA_START=118 /DNA_END=1548 /DNA_ORIENTATION=+